MPLQKKRPVAAKAAGEPKAKKQKQEHEKPIVTKCHVITGSLSTAEGVSYSTLQMFEVGVKACLKVLIKSWHAVQNSMVEMISAAKVGALRGKLAEADAEKANRKAIAEAAAATMKEKSGAVAGAQKALEEAEVATNIAKEAQKVAVSERKVGDADLLKAYEKKAMAEKVVSEDLCPLLDGTSADIGKYVKSVAQVGKEFGLEAELIQSAEVALRTVPAERGSFDTMVIQQIKEQFGKAIAKWADQLTNGEVGKAERASKVKDCNTRVDAAVAHREACQEQFEAAKATLEEAEAARAAAEKSVENLAEMEKTVANAEAPDALSVACKADVATFVELVEGPLAAPGAAPAEATNVEAAQAADV